MAAPAPSTTGRRAPPEPLEILPAGGDTGTPRNLGKRIELVTSWLRPLAGRPVLDCGCGGGEYVRALGQRGATAWGLEILGEKLRNARAGARGRLVRGDAQRAPFAAGSFSAALMNEMLEHVPDDGAALHEVHRLLVPGGLLVVLSPNRLYPFETHGVVGRRSGRLLSHALPFVPWIPLAIGRRFFRYWARNYWPWELRQRLRSAGFECLRVAYVWQTFENVSGRQPAWLRPLAPALRRLAGLCERIPGLRAFGVSQAVLACRVQAPAARRRS